MLDVQTLQTRALRLAPALRMRLCGLLVVPAALQRTAAHHCVRALHSSRVVRSRTGSQHALSLMTFNVLAPCYFRHGGRLESDDRVAYMARAQAVIQAIRREQCDLICLQEFWFNREYQAAFRQTFQHSHYLHTIKRPGNKEDGLAMFVNKSKFDIHHVHHIEFDNAGDRVALMMHVATKWNRHQLPLAQRSFLLINSHLTFPHCEIYKDMRLSQIKLVLESIRRYVTRERLHHAPVLMCGDFNDFNDPVHNMVMDHGFASVFSHVHGREARITHCNHNNREVGVDFIFASHLKGLGFRHGSEVHHAQAQGRRIEGGEPSHHHVHHHHHHHHHHHNHHHHLSSIRALEAMEPRLHLRPVHCELLPRNLPDGTRLKRPSFGHDWQLVEHPHEAIECAEDDLVDYWRMVSDHRPLVAKFDVYSPPYRLPPHGR